MELLKKIDIFGQKIELTFRGTTSIKTPFGGCVLIILLLISTLLIVGIGQDFFKRINPTVKRETETLKNWPTYIS